MKFWFETDRYEVVESASPYTGVKVCRILGRGQWT